MGVANCNRLCRLAGLAILLAATWVTHVRSPIFGDFVQFQMAGLVDRAGSWGALYPVPIAGSIHNAGDFRDSVARPRADEIATAHGIDFVPYHFILPPQAALLFWPLGYVNGPIGHQFWLLASVLAGWIAAVQAGAILQRCAGRQTRWSGLITLVIAAMPAMRRAVMVANLTPMLAATIGWAVLSLMDDEADFGSALAIVIGTICKYAAAALLPIALVQRRWRTVGRAAGIMLTWTLIALAIMGRAPFVEFATAIVPTLARSHELPDNISLTGVLLHALHCLPPLPAGINSALSIARLLVLGAILFPIIRIGRDRMRESAAVCAAAMSLLAWLLFFSPVAWSHYLIYLCPLWGWLACPFAMSRWRRAAAWIAMGLIILSPDQTPPPAFDPWGVHLLLSLGLMLSLGISSLYSLIPFRAPQIPRPLAGYQWTPRFSDQSSLST
jgi:hypothetical protein